jgi:hypothetical protein
METHLRASSGPRSAGRVLPGMRGSTGRLKHGASISQVRQQQRTLLVGAEHCGTARIRPARAAVKLSAWESGCHASLTTAPQVRRHLPLSVGTRQVPLLTLLTGMQRARDPLLIRKFDTVLASRAGAAS